MTRIELDDGKYTVVHDSGAGLHALRYGERWRDMTGDGLVLAMAQEIEDLRRRIVPVQQVSVPDASTDFSQFLSAVMDAAGLVRHGRRSKELSEYLGSKCMEYRCFAAPAAPAADAPPENCRQRLAADGKPYPKSSCAACGQFSPKWRECDEALAAHRTQGAV